MFYRYEQKEYETQWMTDIDLEIEQSVDHTGFHIWKK